MPKGAGFKVPRLYKAAAKVAKLVKEENANLEQLIQENNKKTNVKALAALVNKCLASEKMLDKIIKKSEILVKEKFDNLWVVRILITELLLGKQRLPVGSPTIQTILAYGPVLKTEHLKAQGKFHGKGKKKSGAAGVKHNENLNTESEVAEDSTEGTEHASDSKAILKKKKQQHNTEGNQHEGEKSKKRKGENGRYFEMKRKKLSDDEYEEHQRQTKNAKKKKGVKLVEENEDGEEVQMPECITLQDDDDGDEVKVQERSKKKRKDKQKVSVSGEVDLSAKPLWGEQQDYIKLEDDSIKSMFDESPKKKKKRYPVKKDKFSAEKRFSRFKNKSKRGRNAFK